MQQCVTIPKMLNDTFLLLLQYGLHHQEPEKVVHPKYIIVSVLPERDVKPEIAAMLRLVIIESKAACGNRI